MTKQQELARLESLIKSLGPDTYLAPWLQSVKSEVEQCIKSDIFPEISLADTAEQIRKQKETAERESEKIIQAAQREAGVILKEAQNKMNRTYDKMRDMVTQINHIIN